MTGCDICIIQVVDYLFQHSKTGRNVYVSHWQQEVESIEMWLLLQLLGYEEVCEG